MSYAVPPLLRSQALEHAPGIFHGFTTREGGLSAGPLASLNLAARPGEDARVLRENWERVTRALHPDLGADAVALLEQVHGAEVAEVAAPAGPHRVVARADAAVTRVAGIVLAVRTADCVPVLLAAPGAIGVAHAGWRGTVAGVVPAAVRALCDLADLPPSEVHAVVGPHISGAAYEVGDEVVRGLRGAGLPEESFLRPRRHVDLGGAVRAQLHAAGVGRIGSVQGCTARDHRFYSHRRDGPSTGRLAGVIARIS